VKGILQAKVIDLVTPPSTLPAAEQYHSKVWRSAPLVLIGKSGKDPNSPFYGPALMRFEGRMGTIRLNHFLPTVSLHGIRAADAARMEEMRSSVQKIIKVLFFAERRLIPAKWKTLIESEGTGGFGGRATYQSKSSYTGMTCKKGKEGTIDVCGH